jgi:hypothetical protein
MSGEHASNFVKAKIGIYMDRDWNLVHCQEFVLVEPELINELADLMPRLGRRVQSRTAGGWYPRVRITFTCADCTELKVVVHPGLRFWTEGHGDWPMRPGLEDFLARVAQR